MNRLHLAQPRRTLSWNLGRLLGPPMSPWLPIAVYVPASAGLVLLGVLLGAPAWQVGVLPLLGLALWSLLEYGIHSLAFHHTLRFLRLEAVQSAHARHHDHPSRPEHMVSQLSFSAPVALVLFGLLYLTLGSLAAAALVLAGSLLGYLAYEVVHFQIHQRRKPFWLPRGLVKHHLYHHHKDQGRCFGVTSPLWDMVFRTSFKTQSQRG